jgi:hypothetical protein
VGDLVVVAEELGLLAGALASTGSQLSGIADARRDLASLVDSSPSRELRDATEDLLTAWELLVWDAGDECEELAREARRTAEGFSRVERTLRGGPYFATPVRLR